MPTGKEDYERLYGGTPAISQGQVDYERLYGAPAAPRPPSDLTIDIEKTSPDTAAAPEGAFARYTGTPDLPLEESLNPAELGISGLGAKVGLRVATTLAPKAGRLLQVGAEGLGLEVGHKVNQATGQTPGSILDFGWPDVVNLAAPIVLNAPGLVRDTLRYTRAGQAVRVADTATAADRTAYETTLAEAEAAHTAQVAADRTRLMPDGSLPPATAVPQRLQSLRATPPTPVEPGNISMPGRGHMLSELGMGSLLTPFLGTKTGATIAGGMYLADSAEALVSKALMSPTLRPWFLRQLEANGGTVNPAILATLTAVMQGAVPAATQAP